MARSPEKSSDKKVVLFGRTGAGKSTVANALVTGGIDTVVFEFNDSTTGCTFEVTEKSGRGWTVLDTVGVGGADLGTGSGIVTSTQAKEQLTDYLKKFKDEYSHIIYVQKATNRITTMDEIIWALFESIFQGAEDAFVVLFTWADQPWLDQNFEKLPEYLKKKSIVTTNIPSTVQGCRPVRKRREAKIREESILRLESDLNRLFEERGQKYYTPYIAKLSDVELEDKSEGLIKFFCDKIRLLFDKERWMQVAITLKNVINLTGVILTGLSLASLAN